MERGRKKERANQTDRGPGVARDNIKPKIRQYLLRQVKT